jgi:hypothetical protein
VNDFPEITTEQIVARLRMIVAEPDSLCKTDLHYIEDAADELESKGDEIERLRAERDEARREILLWVKERCSWVELAEEIKKRGWEYLKEDGK